jgi:hypothetical protein
MGIVGFLFSIPGVVTGYMHDSSLAKAFAKEAGTMSSPLLCGAAVVAGLVWMRATKQHESKRSLGRFTEEAGPDGGGDGGAD